MGQLVITSKMYGSHTILYDDSDKNIFLGKKMYLKKDKNAKTMYVAMWWLDNGVKKVAFMHRLIMNITDPKLDIDHRNSNGLDNRRDNLRVCTHSQNMANRGCNKNNNTGFKGVSLVERKRKKSIKKFYQAKLGTKYLGVFHDIQLAAYTYNVHCILRYGEFAVLNQTIYCLPNINPIFKRLVDGKEGDYIEFYRKRLTRCPNLFGIPEYECNPEGERIICKDL